MSTGPFDIYNLKARLAPALFVVFPLVVLAAGFLPLLPGLQGLWTLVSLGVLPFVALKSSEKGNDVQEKLYSTWGGKPSTVRMRFRDNLDAGEITRRHREVEVATSAETALPGLSDETTSPTDADARYDAAIARLRIICHQRKDFRLLRLENRGYGYARNLFGLRTWGMMSCWFTIVLSLALVALYALLQVRPVGLALPIASTVLSIVFLFFWRGVTPAWVRLSADRYADQLLGAASLLAAEATQNNDPGDSAGQNETPT